jgi:plasmid stability protein
MRQLTLRVPEELAERLKVAAGDHEVSVNGYAVKVLSAAVDPDLAGDEITGLKERLARAGLLLTPERISTKHPSARALSRARAAAGRGRPLSDFVTEGRR